MTHLVTFTGEILNGKPHFLCSANENSQMISVQSFPLDYQRSTTRNLSLSTKIHA